MALVCGLTFRSFEGRLAVDLVMFNRATCRYERLMTHDVVLSGLMRGRRFYV